MHLRRFLRLSFMILLIQCTLPGPLLSEEATSSEETANADQEPGTVTVANVAEVIDGSGQTETGHCLQCNFSQSNCQCQHDPGWDGGFEIGLNGAEGNSRNLNLVVGLDGTRKVGLDTYTIDIDYLFSRDETEVTKDRFYSLGRYVHDIPQSPWGWFFDKWFEYDGLESFRSRLGLHAGGIYTFEETDTRTVRGLVGFGTSKEFQGSDQDWKPEGFVGTLMEKQITENQKFWLRAVLYPDVGQADSYRINARAGWEYTVSRENDLKFSISAFDRFDSTPSEGDRKNNIDYWASLIWGF